MDTTIDAALQAVDRSRFCLDERGEQFPQTSAPEVVAACSAS